MIVFNPSVCSSLKMCRGIARLIEDCSVEYENEKFLLHSQDMWSDKNQNSMLGSSIKLITRDMRCLSIATCLIPNNESHKADYVAGELDRIYMERYGFPLSQRVLFTGSDTTPLSRNVSYHLDAIQGDCEMHSSQLALAYGIGYKENTRTKSVVVDGKVEKVTDILTPGGPFPQGLELLLSFAAIVNHFDKSGQKKKELHDLCVLHDLPIVALKNPAKTRVASHIALLQSVLHNYVALKHYAMACPPKSPYLKLWRTITPNM